MIILDCTFRDGGYYTDWKFDLKLVNKYLKVIEESRIDAVEIGFRNPIKSDKTFANMTDNFIKENLYTPDIEYFGVMIDTAKTPYKNIKKIFSYADESPINLVRAATHFKDIDLGENVCKELKNLGYTVTCNLMQAAGKSYEEIREGAKKIKKWNAVDVLYLADSLGGMNHDSVNYSFKAIKEGWSGLTGFHGHNNKSNALGNSLEAVDIGVDWIDSTIYGMGRGPGNTEIEYLLHELNKRNYEFNINPIYRLVLGEFQSLKEQYRWGPSLPYYLSAEYNIHPIYIQKMLLKYPSHIVLKAIFYLKNKDARFFNDELFK
jgi:4-hydroxy 2-oxovalerate aldolase